jgi:hypothetical protein
MVNEVMMAIQVSQVLEVVTEAMLHQGFVGTLANIYTRSYLWVRITKPVLCRQKSWA